MEQALNRRWPSQKNAIWRGIYRGTFMACLKISTTKFHLSGLDYVLNAALARGFKES